jgi:hypothetical protein
MAQTGSGGSNGSNAQAAVGKVQQDVKADWSDFVTWFSGADAVVQARLHQILDDAKAAGSAIATEVKGLLPAAPTAAK